MLRTYPFMATTTEATRPTRTTAAEPSCHGLMFLGTGMRRAALRHQRRATPATHQITGAMMQSSKYLGGGNR